MPYESHIFSFNTATENYFLTVRAKQRAMNLLYSKFPFLKYDLTRIQNDNINYKFLLELVALFRYTQSGDPFELEKNLRMQIDNLPVQEGNILYSATCRLRPHYNKICKAMYTDPSLVDDLIEQTIQTAVNQWCT